MNSVVISLGSNVGDRLSNLMQAASWLEESGAEITKRSSVYETAPWGNTDQPSFYNQVMEIRAREDADEMMKIILSIEEKMGRKRTQKWEPRIIDIDILFFNDEQIHKDHLAVPHPHLHERRFVLVPLAEMMPGKIHPVFHKSVAQLLSSLEDESVVEKLKPMPHA